MLKYLEPLIETATARVKFEKIGQQDLATDDRECLWLSQKVVISFLAVKLRLILDMFF